MRHAELHCKTNFSFLEGASHASELAERAAALGYSALAVTDRNTLSGMVRAHAATKAVGLKLIVGAEIAPVDAPPVVLWASNREGYGQLCRLITVGRQRAKKGQCELTFADVAEHSEGLLAGVCCGGREATLANSPGLQAGETESNIPQNPEGGDVIDGGRIASPPSGLKRSARSVPWAKAQGYSPPSLRDSLRYGDAEGSQRSTPGTQPLSHHITNYRDIFGDRCYLLVALHNGSDDERLLNEYIRLSRETNIPLVASGDVHFHTPARLPLQHVLTCIRHGVTLAEAGSLLFPNAERCLQPLAVIQAKFASIPDAVERTLEIVDRCNFDMGKLKYEYPLELSPDGIAPIEHLKKLTWEGAKERYQDGIPEEVCEQIRHELKLIEKLRYEAFFLTVYDAVKFARSRTPEILCQGRGSAANSVVCYCLGVTSADPGKINLLFERFISEERREEPDIDVDFEHERREEVIQYLYQKYGRERAGIAATVIRYRRRSAIRDVGKVLGLSLDKVDALSKSLKGYVPETDGLKPVYKEAGIDVDSAIGQRFAFLTEELIGFPRHLSQHVGGMVITQGPLCELVPIENASMQDRTVVEWDKNDLEELGILKVDCLALGMLTAIRKCFELVQQQTGECWTLATIPNGDEGEEGYDKAVYDMICAADVIGCFQIESRAQMSMLPRLKPRKYYDLVVEVAIVRPGPIQGGMVHPYLRARDNPESVSYPNDNIRKVLEKTLGVPIFQEQVMQLAVVAAGFTPGEADQLRRSMGAWERKGDLERFRDKLMDGMRERGLSQKFSDQIFEMIKGFGEYGFPESHSASFALLAYASAWLKCHYQAAFTTALLNSQPMGFYSPSQLIQDARRHEVKVLPIDINHSDWDCTLEDINTIRLGVCLAKSISKQTAETITHCRAEGRFVSMDNFVARTKLSRAVVVKLTEADAFGSLEVSRREAYWSALSQEESRQAVALLEATNDEEPTVELPARSQWEEVCDDYLTTGLTLREHPMSFVREQLNNQHAVRACDLGKYSADQIIRIAGIITGRQRPLTAQGVTFATLEDETGFANLVLYEQVWKRYARILRQSNFWLVTGKLQKEGGVIHVVVQRVVDYQPQIEGLHAKSRDFQ